MSKIGNKGGIQAGPMQGVFMASLVSTTAAAFAACPYSALGFLQIFAGGCFVSYIVCCLFGLPAHVILRSLKWGSLSAYALAGLLGSAVLVFLIRRHPIIAGSNIFISPFPEILMSGPVAAITFWWTVRPDRPSEIIKQ
jgi:hypothetical protein